MDTRLLIGIETIKEEVQNTNGLIPRLHKAMECAQSLWCGGDDDLRFRAAIGAVLSSYEPEAKEHKRLRWNIIRLNKVAAALKAIEVGVPVDMKTLKEEVEEFKPIHLLEMWLKAKEE